MRIGSGFDVHRFGEPGSAASIRLGGIDVPHDRELIAHSDGDVVIHALCDALLGALALGDIGKHFPDSDERYAGADSRQLLREVNGMILGRGYSLGNADITIIAEQPRIAAHVVAMCHALAEDLACEPGAISVKATTTEKSGYLGREEAIAAQAVVLVNHVPE